MKKSAVLAVLLALAGVMVIYQNYSASATRRRPQNQPRQPTRQDKREQSRAVYKGTGNAHDHKLREVAAQAEGDVRVEIGIGLPAFTPYARAFELREFLRNRACDADAIVVGTVGTQASRLTEDESFIYTDNELKVEDVIKGNSLAAVNVGNSITVMRAGGTLRLSGRTVVAEHKAARPLKVGKRYLLFLTFLPDRGAYVADNISYELDGDKIHKLTGAQLHAELESGNDARRMIEEVRAAGGECGDTEGSQQP
jgi:hypothetical protein